MTNTKLVNKQEQAKHDFRKFEVFADLGRQDLTWNQYGSITAPLVVRNHKGELTSRSRFKLWIQNGQFKKMLPNTYAFYPHEEVDHILSGLFKSKFDGLDMDLIEQIPAHDGDTHYWKLTSKEVFEVEKGDKIKLGVVIRNGIGTNVSLGVDLYTHRLWCENGALAKGKNIGTFSISHVGSYERIKKVFETSIIQTFGHVKKLLEYYRKSTMITVTDKMASEIYEKMIYAGHYLPNNWEVKPRREIEQERKDGKLDKNANLVKVNGKQTLWAALNDITEKQRDGLRTKRITFPSVANHQSKLHQQLITIVDNKGRKY